MQPLKEIQIQTSASLPVSSRAETAETPETSSSSHAYGLSHAPKYLQQLRCSPQWECASHQAASQLTVSPQQQIMTSPTCGGCRVVFYRTTCCSSVWGLPAGVLEEVVFFIYIPCVPPADHMRMLLPRTLNNKTGFSYHTLELERVAVMQSKWGKNARVSQNQNFPFICVDC